MKKAIVMLLMGAMLVTACGQTSGSAAPASETKAEAPAEDAAAQEAEAPAEDAAAQEAEAPAADAAAQEAEAPAADAAAQEAEAPAEDAAAAGATVAATAEIEDTAGELDEFGQARTEQEGYVAAYSGKELEVINNGTQSALGDGMTLPDSAVKVEAKDETEEAMEQEIENSGQEVNTINFADLGSLGKASVSISASSTLKEKGYDHSPSKVLDGDVSTVWSEGVSGYGIGEYLRISVPRGTVFHGIGIISGHQKSEDLFWKNSAPNSIIVGSGDVYYRVLLNPRYGYYEEIELPGIVSDGSFYVFIDNVRPGSKYMDTCISELWAW